MRAQRARRAHEDDRKILGPKILIGFCGFLFFTAGENCRCLFFIYFFVRTFLNFFAPSAKKHFYLFARSAEQIFYVFARSAKISVLFLCARKDTDFHGEDLADESSFPKTYFLSLCFQVSFGIPVLRNPTLAAPQNTHPDWDLADATTVVPAIAGPKTTPKATPKASRPKMRRKLFGYSWSDSKSGGFWCSRKLFLMVFWSCPKTRPKMRRKLFLVVFWPCPKTFKAGRQSILRPKVFGQVWGGFSGTFSGTVSGTVSDPTVLGQFSSFWADRFWINLGTAFG